jgi:hypothetical protein
MNTVVRIILVILCIVALYYLVVVLARSVADEETGSSVPVGNDLTLAAALSPRR